MPLLEDIEKLVTPELLRRFAFEVGWARRGTDECLCPHCRAPLEFISEGPLARWRCCGKEAHGGGSLELVMIGRGLSAPDAQALLAGRVGLANYPAGLATRAREPEREPRPKRVKRGATTPPTLTRERPQRPAKVEPEHAAQPPRPARSCRCAWRKSGHTPRAAVGCRRTWRVSEGVAEGRLRPGRSPARPCREIRSAPALRPSGDSPMDRRAVTCRGQRPAQGEVRLTELVVWPCRLRWPTTWPLKVSGSSTRSRSSADGYRNPVVAMTRWPGPPLWPHTARANLGVLIREPESPQFSDCSSVGLAPP